MRCGIGLLGWPASESGCLCYPTGAYPAERAFRDVRTSTLMPPTMDRMLEAIGKSALGLDAAMFNIPGSPPR